MGRLGTRQTIFLNPFKFRRVCRVCSGELWLARKNNCFLLSIFPAGEGGFRQMMYRSPERSPQDSRDGFFWYSAQASFSWPRVDLARLLRVYQSPWDSFLYLGNLHWFLYLLLSYFYHPGMFIFRWSSNFVEKVVLKGSMAAKMASRVSYLVYYYCIYSEFEQIITKLRWSIKDNNN